MYKLSNYYKTQDVWTLFLISAFPLHVWTLLLGFQDISWLAERTNFFDALSVISYGLVFALFESLLLLVVVLLLGMTALAYTLRPWLGVDGPAFSSVYQGAIRFNTYVGLAVALAVFHTEGGTVAALVMALMIPLINVLCVLVLSAHAGGSISVTGVLRGLITNPLILACLVGIGLNLSGIGLPWGSAAMLDILARAALPLGLLAVGAGLRLAALNRPGLLVAVSALKLLVLPALAATLCWLVQPGQLETAVLMTFAALPGSSTAYILARQLGGDAPLMAAIVTVETGLALVTLPAVLVWVV